MIFTQLSLKGQSSWVCDADGSNLTQKPITLLAGTELKLTNGNASPKLSADGLKVYFVANDFSGTYQHGKIYSCNLD